MFACCKYTTEFCIMCILTSFELCARIESVGCSKHLFGRGERCQACDAGGVFVFLPAMRSPTDIGGEVAQRQWKSA